MGSLAATLLASSFSTSGAQPPDQPVSPASSLQKFELSAGVDGTGPSWSTYSGVTAAPVGDLRDNGYRLRFGGGYGHYRYTRPVFDPNSRRYKWPEFFGEQSSIDLLIGYHWAVGPTTLKAYAGLTEEHHQLTPGPESPIEADDDNGVQGRRRGPKVVLETWTRLADWGFFQLDANWSQPFEAYGGRIRTGYFLGNGWSSGLETAVFGNLNHDGGRAGAFARYDAQWGEVSVSAGFDGDRDRIGGGYASMGVIVRF
ncbi:MAG: cellulose biosynthesis protein BcsS [Hyphomicrobiaceae bacterium]